MIPNNFISPINPDEVDKFEKFYLQKQWYVKTEQEISINPIPKFLTPFCSFLPNQYLWISSETQLKEIWQKDIASQKVLGIDIEQTFHQSYFGYICLIQISTSTTDYILDILALRPVIKEYLNGIFGDPKIVKIFYSGDNDLFWLKRDFSISVCNYFDVKIAALFLNKTIDCSLANLIDTFCESGKMDRKKKKILQVSDWWKRPLTEEQINYAALDSHYLIFLREKLLQVIFEKVKDFTNLYNFFEKIEELTKRIYHPKEFNKVEYYEMFNKLLKTNKAIIPLQNKKEISQQQEEEKKIELDDDKTNLDKKKAQYWFIKLAEIRDENARKQNIGLEDLCSTNSLFELSKKSNKLSLEEFIISNKFNEQDKSFIMNNLSTIDKIFDIKGEQIKEEIDKIMNSNIIINQNEKEKRKKERLKLMEDMLTRKSPAYENYSILAPDGCLLCHCDKKKVEWYLARNLAVSASEDNRTIKLTFEPQGRGFSELEFIDNKFYTVDRDNKCVVCGSTDKYLKYHIVPLLYREHFPNSFKSHRSHDVVLLCLNCHVQANKETEKLKLEIAQKFDCPVIGPNNPLLLLRNKVLTMTKFGLSYWKNKDAIPKDRKKILKVELRNLYSELEKEEKIKKFMENEGFLFNFNKNNLIKIDEKFVSMCKHFSKNHKNLKENSNKDFKNLHGKMVVEKLKTNQELKDFILLWRKNFIDKLNPKHLPTAWNVYHQFEREFGELSKFNDKNMKKIE